MRVVPFADPGVPDTNSPTRFLIWLARQQQGVLALGILFSALWMISQAMLPWVIGQGINAMTAGDSVAPWVIVVAALGSFQALAGMARHRFNMTNWYYPAFRTIQLITTHTARTGPAVARTMPTGEVVATVSGDAPHIAHLFNVLPRFIAAVVSYLVVAIIVINMSFVLGMMVLIGVPVLVIALFPIIQPLQIRQRAHRKALGELTSLGADTVAGLRALRGIGGENVFLSRYHDQSQGVRGAGVQLARTQSLLGGVMIMLPGIFLVLLTWLGARLVVNGAVEPGSLVAMYGFAFFLIVPVRTAGEATYALTRAIVGAKRVIRILDIEPEVHESIEPTAPADGAGRLVDVGTGTNISPGHLTMLVSDNPVTVAAIADRLGRLTDDGEVTLDDVPLSDLRLADVRRRIVVSDPEPRLFTGTLRTALDPAGLHDETDLRRLLDVVAASDVLESLNDDLEGVVDERARSLSGGQRQRVALARVLLRDPEILILVEPTSAVDAHTEETIAKNLRTARQGKTTVVATESPLLLDRADTVVWFADGRVSAVGTHHHLMSTVPAYRRTVVRETEVPA